MASKLSDMQLGDSMDIGPFLTKKEMKQTRWVEGGFPVEPRCKVTHKIISEDFPCSDFFVRGVVRHDASTFNHY